MKSDDHTTLVAAIKAANYVTSVAASGPLTVFAPTNAAFEKLPAGTVESLVKAENVAKLRETLKYHVTTSAYDGSWFSDGQKSAMANGKKATIGIADGKVTINGAKVVASIKASTGMLHVIDTVLLPAEKKWAIEAVRTSALRLLAAIPSVVAPGSYRPCPVCGSRANQTATRRSGRAMSGLL